MLLTRVFTAIVLLAVILPVLFFGSPLAVSVVCTLFFAVACWESWRLFGYRSAAIFITLVATPLFFFIQLIPVWTTIAVVYACIALLILFVPALKWGLPKLGGILNLLFSVSYTISLFACFSMVRLLLSMTEKLGETAEVDESALWMLSLVVIVWIADIGGYFVGKAFGRHKLAPTVSPGKSWEGALGGWALVLLYGVVASQMTLFSGTFPYFVKMEWGWPGLLLVLTLLTVVSVLGDLIESQLKRRVGMKDSSQTLPGHGGVLDRVDSLIFVVPAAIVILSLMAQWLP